MVTRHNRPTPWVTLQIRGDAVKSIKGRAITDPAFDACFLLKFPLRGQQNSLGNSLITSGRIRSGKSPSGVKGRAAVAVGAVIRIINTTGAGREDDIEAVGAVIRKIKTIIEVAGEAVGAVIRIKNRIGAVDVELDVAATSPVFDWEVGVVVGDRSACIGERSRSRENGGSRKIRVRVAGVKSRVVSIALFYINRRNYQDKRKNYRNETHKYRFSIFSKHIFNSPFRLDINNFKIIGSALSQLKLPESMNRIGIRSKI
jgi:hypothetical protein